MPKIVSKEPVPLSASTPSRSLHLLPNVPKDVSADELSCIRDQHSGARILVISESVKRSVAKPSRRKTESVAEPEVPPVVEDDQEKIEHSEVATELIAKSVTAITADLEEKEQLMEADEYEALLRQLLDLEQAGDVNRESPRVTLIRHLETKLEQ